MSDSITELDDAVLQLSSDILHQDSIADQLRNNLKSAQAKYEAHKNSVSAMKSELRRKQNDLAQLRSRKKKLNKGELSRITDHAIVRYLERALCVDIDQVRKMMLTPEVLKASKSMTNCKMAIDADDAEPVQAVMIDGVIITVKPV